MALIANLGSQMAYKLRNQGMFRVKFGSLSYHRQVGIRGDLSGPGYVAGVTGSQNPQS